MRHPGDCALRKGHWWVVAAVTDSGLLIVNLTKIKKDFAPDTACLIHPKEERFVTDESFIIYRLAEVRTVEEIEADLAQQEVTVRDHIKDDLLRRIQAGFSASKWANPRHIEMMAQYLAAIRRP